MSKHPHLRPANEADRSFLFDAFVSGRPELLGLPRELVQLQLAAQRRQYAESYPAAIEEIIVFEGRATGRWIVSRSASEYRLLDICVMSGYRGRGIGGALVSNLIEQAAAASVPARLSVWHTNVDALRLYRRLGFEFCGEHHGYLSMQAVPVQTSSGRAVVA